MTFTDWLLIATCLSFCVGMGACVMHLLGQRDALLMENAGLRELVIDPDAPEPAFAPIDPQEQHDLAKAYERDRWAGEWNSVPTAIDRLLRLRGEAYADRHRKRANNLLGPDALTPADSTNRTTP